MEVHEFLEMCRPKIGAKVDQYKQLMMDQDIDGEVLCDMGDDELVRSVLPPMTP